MPLHNHSQALWYSRVLGLQAWSFLGICAVLEALLQLGSWSSQRCPVLFPDLLRSIGLPGAVATERQHATQLGRAVQCSWLVC